MQLISQRARDVGYNSCTQIPIFQLNDKQEPRTKYNSYASEVNFRIAAARFSQASECHTKSWIIFFKEMFSYFFGWKFSAWNFNRKLYISFRCSLRCKLIIFIPFVPPLYRLSVYVRVPVYVYRYSVSFSWYSLILSSWTKYFFEKSVLKYTFIVVILSIKKYFDKFNLIYIIEWEEYLYHLQRVYLVVETSPTFIPCIWAFDFIIAWYYWLFLFVPFILSTIQKYFSFFVIPNYF